MLFADKQQQHQARCGRKKVICEPPKHGDVRSGVADVRHMTPRRFAARQRYLWHAWGSPAVRGASTTGHPLYRGGGDEG